MTYPTVQFLEFDKDVDPSGSRHLLASAEKALDTSITGYLDFGYANTTTSGVISDTKLILFRVSDFGDASKVFNMKFFLNNSSAFDTGSYRFLYLIATHFQGAGFTLQLSDSDMPTTEPLTQNILATSGFTSLSGVADGDVSQYVYLAVYVDTSVPYGTYGGGGAGSFRYRMVYDFS